MHLKSIIAPLYRLLTNIPVSVSVTTYIYIQKQIMEAFEEVYQLRLTPIYKDGLICGLRVYSDIGVYIFTYYPDT